MVFEYPVHLKAGLYSDQSTLGDRLKALKLQHSLFYCGVPQQESSRRAVGERRSTWQVIFSFFIAALSPIAALSYDATIWEGLRQPQIAAVIDAPVEIMPQFEHFYTDPYFSYTLEARQSNHS